MKGADKTVLLVLPLIVLIGVFWFVVVAPKRSESADLSDQVTQLQASVSAQEQIATAAEAARKTFPTDYRRLVVLGKAVPETANTPSLLVSMNFLARSSGINFDSLTLSEGSGTTATPAISGTPDPGTTPGPPASDAPADDNSGSDPQLASSAAAPATPAPATETAAAALPIGATVGPAGLPVMPYEMAFTGQYFNVTDFIGKIDQQIGLKKNGSPSVFGRLVTVDGFSLTVPQNPGTSAGAGIDLTDPVLSAQFAVTTYLTPPGQGLTAGASPAGPSPASPTPVSAPASPEPSAPVASVGGGTR